MGGGDAGSGCACGVCVCRGVGDELRGDWTLMYVGRQAQAAVVFGVFECVWVVADGQLQASRPQGTKKGMEEDDGSCV